MDQRRRHGVVAVRPPLSEDITINVCLDPVDFRMGINGLSVLIEASLKYDPFSCNLFCFTNKRKNQIKVLYWRVDAGWRRPVCQAARLRVARRDPQARHVARMLLIGWYTGTRPRAVLGLRGL